jgi:hypothetical protein
MKKQQDYNLDELYNSYFVKVRVTGNKSRRTSIEDYSMSVSASFLDEESRKGIAKITKQLQRLPEKFSNMKLGKSIIIHESKVKDFQTEFDKLEKEFNDFISQLDLDNLQKLHDERSDIEINKDQTFLTSVEQVTIPDDTLVLHDWFHASYELKKLKRDQSFLSGIIDKTKEYLENVDKQIQKKTNELQTKENLVKEEKERLELQLQTITERRDRIQQDVEKKFKDGIKNKEDEHIALIDSQISLQLQEFYLTLQKALDDFKDNGKINGMKIKSIENKIQELKQVNSVFKSSSVEAIVDSLEGFPQAFREAQMKLHSESGELPDFDVFEIDFKSIKHVDKLDMVQDTMQDFKGFNIEIEQAFNLHKEKTEPKEPEDKTSKTTKKKKGRKKKGKAKQKESSFEFEPIPTN